MTRGRRTRATPRLTTSRIDLSTRSPETTPLFDDLRRFARRHHIPAPIWRAMHASLDEVVTNVLTHAGSPRKSVEISVTLAVRGRAMEATVTDSGRAFNPLTVADPRTDQPLAERPVGGLGIFLVKRTMDSVTYARVAGSNRLVMRKLIPPARRPARRNVRFTVK